MNRKFNKEQVVKVIAQPKLENTYYIYKPEIKFLGITLRKSGFFTWLAERRIDISTENHVFIEGEKIFYFPHIDVYLSDGKCVILWYNSVSKMEFDFDLYFKDFYTNY